MDNSYKDRRTKNYSRMRSIMDIAMGIFYLAGAVFLVFAERMGVEMELFIDNMIFRYIFAGICAIYGTWRIYRGYKKEYF